MDDLIKRSEAYSAIGFERCNKDCTKCPTKCTWFYTINNIPAVNQWISCKDRLPEKHGEYLVCFGMFDCTLNGTDVIDKRYFGEKSDGKVGWHSLCSSDITHWMPLPEPPEMEE